MLDLFGDEIVPGKAPGVLKDDVKFIFNHWCKVMKKNSKTVLDKKRKARIIEALKLGYPVDFLCRSIDGCALDDYNMGRDPRNRLKKKYNDISLIFRDAEHIERFEELASATEAKRAPKVEKPKREIWELEGFESYDQWFEKKYGVKKSNELHPMLRKIVKKEIDNVV